MISWTCRGEAERSVPGEVLQSLPANPHPGLDQSEALPSR